MTPPPPLLKNPGYAHVLDVFEDQYITSTDGFKLSKVTSGGPERMTSVSIRSC